MLFPYQVADAHCPGHIIPGSDTFELTYYDRPRVELPAELTQQSKGQNYKRSGICAGLEDHVAIDLRGKLSDRKNSNID